MAKRARGFRRLLLTSAAITGTTLLVPGIAQAAFPGANGDVAFVSTRDNSVAVYQVNPAASGIGTTSGDLSNAAALTDGGGVTGGIDAEPFYSPDGGTVYFSSNRSGYWTISYVSQAVSEPVSPAIRLSQSSSGTDDDYAPTVTPDGTTVVFNRDNGSLWTVLPASGPSSACLLYMPPTGLAPAATDGSASRPVFDPVDPTKLLYVGGDNHIHLLSGIPNPLGSGRCTINPSTLTDTDLSETASAPKCEGISGATDADPDWSPDGTEIVFDSTRHGGHTLWLMTNPLGSKPAVAPLWPSLAAPNQVSDTQPVFSPDGNYLAYTQPVPGTQVVDYEVDQVGNPASMATDLTLGAGSSENSQPDWQPTVPAEAPEAPEAIWLPAAGLVITGMTVGLRRRRSSKEDAKTASPTSASSA